MKKFNLKNMKKAFTLAEVLITLGIIGIVAAMTMPTLVAKYEKKQTAVAVKKVYSELLQVIQRAEADHGDSKYWNVNTAHSSDIETNKKFVNTYIQPYYKGFRLLKDGCDNSLWDGNCTSQSATNGITNNGTILSIVTVHGHFYILVDVNGYKKPNLMGRDIFYFNNITGKLMPSGWQANLTREMALNGYTADEGGFFQCKSVNAKTEDDEYTYRHACASLLMIDGWEFKDDYPW